MTGLKSGSGDDLWGDDGDNGEDADSKSKESPDSTTDDSAVEQPDETDEQSETADSAKSAESASAESEDAGSSSSPSSGSASSTEASTPRHPYIVRRAVQDKSVKFERDERLTFFVHDDVIEGERDLMTDVESTLGRNVPKFDVREAVYRAALRNRDDVLEELLEMGYSVDDS